MENSNQNPNTNDPPSSFVIKIPSYEEVIQSQSQPPAQSLFKSSQTFTQAFKSIKNSEFYVPPPSSSSSQSQSRDSSTPAANQAGASSSSAQNRNAILVSNRQVIDIVL
ncbi:hypothetical protein HanIR_Chr00c19g0909821 [Helianthus annuus]|nr:hypothetical protein HanIR_Chr00c19g0909821 [Helianthus annuus]